VLRNALYESFGNDAIRYIERPTFLVLAVRGNQPNGVPFVSLTFFSFGTYEKVIHCIVARKMKDRYGSSFYSRPQTWFTSHHRKDYHQKQELSEFRFACGIHITSLCVQVPDCA